jgi:PKD repeat protein
MGNLTQVGCQTSTGNPLTFHANAGTTYYFQVGNLYPWEQGGSMQFHLDVTPPPQVSFYTNPWDPSKYDTVQFQDNSYDPGQVGFQTYTWNFGDGTTATGNSALHKYVADGNYQVTHTVTTIDGRTATITQTVQVRTHDVAITKITTPASANVGQTKTITVTLRNIAYPETVQIDLYKSTPNGFVWVASLTKAVPALSGNRTTAVNFSYTFTSDDAKLGKVTFKAVATINGARDAYPSDNEAISSITKVAK